MTDKHDREVLQSVPVSQAVDGHVGKMFDAGYDAQAFPSCAGMGKANRDLPASLAFDSPYESKESKPVSMATNVDYPVGGRGEAVPGFGPGGRGEPVPGFTDGKKEDFLSSVGHAIEHAFGIDKPDRPMPVARAYPVSYPDSDLTRHKDS